MLLKRLQLPKENSTGNKAMSGLTLLHIHVHVYLYILRFLFWMKSYCAYCPPILSLYRFLVFFHLQTYSHADKSQS